MTDCASYLPPRPSRNFRQRVLLTLCLLVTCSSAFGGLPVADPEAYIVVAVTDRPAPALGVGSTPRGYTGGASYSGSQMARTLAAEVADDYRLQELSAWTIRALDLRCMLYRVVHGAERQAVLERLRADPRVQLAEPLRMFHTLAAPASATRASTAAFNDPYVDLQHGFSTIHAGVAQQWSQGAGVHIALIDTGVDIDHPDLVGRIDATRDFVGDGAGAGAAERHGTEVAGVIVANANNGLGIVGVAPRATLDVYRACWPETATSNQSLCNSFTLAQALGAAIDDRAGVINLSLGGPADPLLAQLIRAAIASGAVVVAAAPPGGRLDGFPAAINGVMTVAGTSAAGRHPQVLLAPGVDILTTEPGRHFDFASGSSIAAAHVSGVIAMLLSLEPDLSSSAIRDLLQSSITARNGASIDACRALARLRHAPATVCGLSSDPANTLGKR